MAGERVFLPTRHVIKKKGSVDILKMCFVGLKRERIESVKTMDAKVGWRDSLTP
jgi:hypothetical protein